jgi:hypothetical protein
MSNDEYSDDSEFGGVTYGRHPGPQVKDVWQRREPGARRYGLTSSWLGGRGDPDVQRYDDRDYYGETFVGQHPPERHQFDHDRYDESRWARSNPHGSARGYDVDLGRRSYRRWREARSDRDWAYEGRPADVAAGRPAVPSLGEHSGKGPRRSRRDDRIRDDVCEALTRDGDVDASNVEVACEDGVVTLAGTVADRRQKRWAEGIADRVAGVVEVSNRLRIVQPGTDAGPAGH